jgi:hypothetical protein
MQSGINLVVTSGSGFEEMVGPDQKVMFANPGDSSSLLAAMRLQLRADSTRSHYSAINRFTWNNLRGPTLRFYERIAEENGLN